MPVGIAVAAIVAFVVAKNQAEGPDEAVPPPAAGLPETPDYHSLLVAPDNPDRLVLGTHVGLYESTDGGRTWSFAGLEGQDAMNLAGAGERTVWTAGHNVLARSDDGGRTWTDVRPQGLPSLDIHGFARDPDDPATLYAAVAGEGLYRSADAGTTFERVSAEVGGSVFGLVVMPGGRILAGDLQQGILESGDGGRTWRLVEPFGAAGLAANPENPDVVLAAGQGSRGSGLLLSTDAGASWKLVLPLSEGAGPVAWSPSDPEVAYAVGLDGALYRTADGGRSWQAVT